MLFSGIFDGQGYTISGLTYSSAAYVGLFGYNSGTIRNLNITNFNVQYTSSPSSEMRVGCIAGYNNGTIESCTVDGNIVASINGIAMRFGLIAGENKGIISNVSVKGNLNVKGSIGGQNNSFTIGGITGRNYGKIQGVFIKATVYAKNSNINVNTNGQVAFIAGINGSGGTIDACVIMGTCSKEGDTSMQDVCCSNSGTFLNCYKLSSVTTGSQATSVSNISSSTFYEITLKWSREKWNYENVDIENGKYPTPVQD